MKKIFLKNMLLIALSIFMVAGCDAAKPGIKQGLKPKESASAAPDFNLTTVVEGNKITLSALKGKVVIINFWATWCRPCRKEIPGFIKIYERYKTKEVEIIGISLDRMSGGDMASFIQQYNINYPVVFGDNKVTEDYGGIRAIPTTFIVDKKGTIRSKHIGYTSQEVFEEEIEKLLKEKNK